MKTQKFDNYERNKVVSEVEKHFQVKLHKVGSRDIYLKDENGITYWIIGGVGDYHGIPKEMFSEEEKQTIEGVLVIAKRNRNTIDIFTGSLLPLIRNKRFLAVTKIQYQFDIHTKDEILKLKQAPDVRLKRIATISYTPEEKNTDKSIHAAQKIFPTLSEEQAIKMIQELEQLL